MLYACYDVCVESKGQLFGISSLLPKPLHGLSEKQFWVLDLQAGALPAKPSCWPQDSILAPGDLSGGSVTQFRL